MCRRCGEKDRRGSNRDRRARKLWMLAHWGDATTAPCFHCGSSLTYWSIESDRKIPGGPYARWNIVPSCGPCNRSRDYPEIADDCEYG